jgi:hypothetical protein
MTYGSGGHVPAAPADREQALGVGGAMTPLMKTWVVLLLLGCDWAGDPYGGRCPWSQVWGNQAALCHATEYRAELYQACDLAPSVELLPAQLLAVARPGGFLPSPQDGPPPVTPARRLYELQSIRR